MQSIGEMIRDEQRVADGQLRAIADGYKNAFMDASTPDSEVREAVLLFNGRTSLYEDSRREIADLRIHQKRAAGRLAMVAHPETNVSFTHEGPRRNITTILI